MKKACVIGWPIAHSRSPLIHNFWLQSYGMEGVYERLPVEPAALESFFQTLRSGDHVGCNVTMPHKEKSLNFVDEVDDRVRRIGSLNTVYRENGKLKAISTDGPGFVANLLSHVPAFQFEVAHVIILGAGGSARAIVDELLRRGTGEIIVSNRTHARAVELASLFGPSVQAVAEPDLAIHWKACQLLVNTTPISADSESLFTSHLHHVNPAMIVADIVYVPLMTPLLVRAKANGNPVVTGLGMLLHQAVPGFEKWFGVRPQVTPQLHDLVAHDIDPDYTP